MFIFCFLIPPFSKFSFSCLLLQQLLSFFPSDFIVSWLSQPDFAQLSVLELEQCIWQKKKSVTHTTQPQTSTVTAKSFQQYIPVSCSQQFTQTHDLKSATRTFIYIPHAHGLCRQLTKGTISAERSRRRHTDCFPHPFYKPFLTGSFSQPPPPLALPGNDSPPFPAVPEVAAVPSITVPTDPQGKRLFLEALFFPDGQVALAKGLSEQNLLLEQNTVCKAVPWCPGLILQIIIFTRKSWGEGKEEGKKE